MRVNQASTLRLRSHKGLGWKRFSRIGQEQLEDSGSQGDLQLGNWISCSGNGYAQESPNHFQTSLYFTLGSNLAYMRSEASNNPLSLNRKELNPDSRHHQISIPLIRLWRDPRTDTKVDFGT